MPDIRELGQAAAVQGRKGEEAGASYQDRGSRRFQEENATGAGKYTLTGLFKEMLDMPTNSYLQEEHSVQVEKQFQQMKQQLEKQLLDLSRSLAQTKQQLASCSKEAASLQQKYDRANEDLTDMEKQRAVELSMQRNQMQEVIDSLRGELTLLKDQSWRQLREMNEKHRNEINQLRKTMSTEQNTSVELEAKRWEERHRELQQDFITKESALNQQVSNLAKELAKTRDQLALSEQRVRDLEKQLDETCRERDGTAKKLHTETAQVQQLRERVNQLQKDVSVGEETCQQRDQEISNLSSEYAL